MNVTERMSKELRLAPPDACELYPFDVKPIGAQPNLNLGLEKFKDAKGEFTGHALIATCFIYNSYPHDDTSAIMQRFNLYSCLCLKGIMYWKNLYSQEVIKINIKKIFKIIG